MSATRRAVTIIEVLAAFVLVAAATTVCLNLLVGRAAQRRAIQDQQTALQEAANLMERLSALPWDELGDEAAAKARLSDAARQALPDAKLEVRLTQPPDKPAEAPSDEPAAKRITIVIQTEDNRGNRRRPVRLVSWRYREVGP